MQIATNFSNWDDDFKVFEEQYKHHTELIHCDILKIAKNNHDQYQQNLENLQKEISEAEECIKRMELDALSKPIVYQKEYKESIKQYKRELQFILKEKKQLEVDMQEQNSRENLFEDRVSKDQINQALLKQEDRITEQNLKLLQAKQSIYSTEETAISVQRNLQEQTEKIQGSIKKTNLIKEDLGESNMLATKMKARIMKRRAIFYGVFGFISLCFFYMIYSWI